MEERKFVKFKKEEFRIKELIKRSLGKGRISRVTIEYTPVGERIVVSTTRPGYIIGKHGSRIAELTELLKRRFSLENPHIETEEIINPEFDAQNVADEIALGLERFGNLRFKAISYRYLTRIMGAGALGAEIRVSGKLPGERAKTWRFSQGYLKKTGDTARLVDRAQAVAKTKTGIIGIKVSILSPDQKLHDRIDIDETFRAEIHKNSGEMKAKESEEIKEKKVKKGGKKKT